MHIKTLSANSKTLLRPRISGGGPGRGFAVVASEVRSLAQRSSQAAKDINDLITNSNVQVKEGVELVNKAGAALSEIVESINEVVEVVSASRPPASSSPRTSSRSTRRLPKWTR